MSSSTDPNPPAVDRRAARPELMAPAGDWDALRAAVANGADAVYFGLTDFNARQRAHNFTLEELPDTMAYLHRHNVRGYLTFNILVFSDELPRAMELLKRAHEAGVDAVIVQDLGLAALLRRAMPNLEVHGSTQMTLTEPRGVRFVQRLGVRRVVLARELSMDDIARIRGQTDMPVEVFVHGALCVAYSGQCLTSESLGGRSANRGKCAQACRLPYELVVDGRTHELGDVAYLLSPRDLAAHDLVDELVDIGVACFKIEGRLKDATYVAATAQTYRAAIDAAVASRPWRISDEQRTDLAQCFSRGFAPGFLAGVDHQRLVDGTYSKKRGIRLGRVTRVDARSVTWSVEPGTPAVKPGDGVVFQTGPDQNSEVGGRVTHVRPRDRGVEVALHAFDHAQVPAGATVWKTDDPAIRRRLEQSFSRDVVARREPIDVHCEAFAGRALRVTVSCARAAVASSALQGATVVRVAVESDAPVEAARKHPLDVATLREQFGRLGDTPFEIRHVTLTGDAVMAPKSVLNELRRRAVERLMAEREARDVQHDEHALENTRRQIKAKWPSSPVATSLSLHALIRTGAQLDAALAWRSPVDGQPLAGVCCDYEDVRRYGEAVRRARAAGVPIALATTRVVKPHEDGLMRTIAQALGPEAARRGDAVLVRHLAAIDFFKHELPGVTLLGDYALNVANELTAALFLDEGLQRVTASYDLSWRQMRAMLAHVDPARIEVTLHQHMPMFHMEHCVYAHTLSDGGDYRTCGRPCEAHTVSLRDREGVEHPLAPDVGCRNTVFNGTAQSGAEYAGRMREAGLRHFRVELLREPPDEATSLLDRYARILTGREGAAMMWRALRVLNQLGVTRGTLERE